MPSLINLVLLAGGAAAAALAPRACTASYAPVSGFPQGMTTTMCYDTSYYRTADQGQQTASSLEPKCQSLCTDDSKCAAVTTAIQYAADSGLSTGVCKLIPPTEAV